MSQDNLIKFQCTVCDSINYHSHKNKKANPNKLELKKHCGNCRKHIAHKELKK